MTNGAGIAAGVAAGTAAGMSAGMTMAAEAEARSRRLSHMGKDQIVIESKWEIDKVASYISSVWNNVYYDGNNFYMVRKSKFDYGVFGGSILVIFLIQALLFMIMMFHYPVDLITACIITLVISAVIGIYYGRSDILMKYIVLSEIHKSTLKTRVLLKIYDNNGYRNLDEDEILRIEEAIGKDGY